MVRHRGALGELHTVGRNSPAGSNGRSPLTDGDNITRISRRTGHIEVGEDRLTPSG